jgi:hypothetical protein
VSTSVSLILVSTTCILVRTAGYYQSLLLNLLFADLGGGFGPGFLVKGGYDFVGDAYTGGNTPVPDNDPLDTYVSTMAILFDHLAKRVL